ncbi:PglL family O-oligosaccharyltransferase [Halomonas sp.]|uniref:PglL family O-oligosaccharyltransferase n=1 Tax=Halomonas sp. TaxID=1486246 RepID=UPI00298E923D|nr:Wzy polymerase domain-containing protein [Halomonas sp.]MDW7745653.1 Wzy polymerase domain-containing protein [Halomonas sp.]
MTTDTAPNRRLIKWFIGTAIFTFTVLLHITFPNMGGSGLRLPFNATVWMGFTVMMALSMWPATRGVIRYSTFHIGLGLMLLALWLPFLWTWNEASLIALPRMLTVTAGAILLLGLAQLQLTRRDWWWLGMAILLGALMETALGYVQLYLLEPGNWLGYNPETGRPYGIFQQVNVMASFLVTGLVISAWLFGEARDSKFEHAMILLAPLFMPALILVIASRTGWMAALVAVPLVLLHLWNLDSSRFRSWAGTLAVGCLLAIIVSITQGERGRSAESISSQGYRPQVYEHSLRMIAEKPITGWGYGRFQHDFLHSHAEWRTAEEGRATLKEHYSHPHNELLYWGIEGGLMPMLAILAFAGWVAWRLWARGPYGERLLMTALLVPLSVHAMLEYPFYHSMGHWLAFLLLLGLFVNVSGRTRVRVNRYTFGVRAGSWLAVPIVWLFMATHLQALWQVKSYLETSGQNASTLTSIINPLGIPHDLEFLVMSQQLSAAAALGSSGGIETYRQWAVKEATLAPHPKLYRDLVIAHELTTEKDSNMYQRFEQLFPHFAQQMDAQTQKDANVARQPATTLQQ